MRNLTSTHWLLNVYGHHGHPAQPAVAAQALTDNPGLSGNDLYLACGAGDLDSIRRALEADPACIHRTASEWTCAGCGKPLALTALTAVTHSTLIQRPGFRGRLLDSARLLLDAGASVNQPWVDGSNSFSPLYGAAGKNHDTEMTKLLLDAGADPNDGESLYHSMESHSMECARLLLSAGAKVEGSNALHHCLDRDDLARLRLLLDHTVDANDSASPLGSPLLWAIRRARSRAHVEALLAAGADPHVPNKDGLSARKLALLGGLNEIAGLLAQAGAEDALTIEESFVAACARCDEAEARRILTAHPRMFDQLSEGQLRQLPNMVEAGQKDAARLMVRLGWPIAVRGGDWKASALNLAVHQGDASLTRFLLEHGASWTETHGFGGNVHSTLSWASRNMPATRDYIGCAKALIDHGMPIVELDGDYSERLASFLAAERERLRA